MTLSLATFSPLPHYPSTPNGVKSFDLLDVAAHLAAGPTGPPGSQAAQSAPVLVRHCKCFAIRDQCTHGVRDVNVDACVQTVDDLLIESSAGGAQKTDDAARLR